MKLIPFVCLTVKQLKILAVYHQTEHVEIFRCKFDGFHNDVVVIYKVKEKTIGVYLESI